MHQITAAKLKKPKLQKTQVDVERQQQYVAQHMIDQPGKARKALNNNTVEVIGRYCI